MEERYLSRLAAAYALGMDGVDGFALPGEYSGASIGELLPDAQERLIAEAKAAGLKMHYFKRQEPLPRVKKVLGFLRSIAPESLLDVGSGRGAFLFPFMDAFPQVPVTSIDLLEHRVRLMNTLKRGGMSQLTALQRDITAWDAPDASFDVVTLLEVLEHIPDVAAAINNAVRLARRYVVVTAPSKPDNNPEHIHLLTKSKLEELFDCAGCTRLQFDGVNGHLFMVAATGGA